MSKNVTKNTHNQSNNTADQMHGYIKQNNYCEQNVILKYIFF